jgi:hypothetical protein
VRDNHPVNAPAEVSNDEEKLICYVRSLYFLPGTVYHIEVAILDDQQRIINRDEWLFRPEAATWNQWGILRHLKALPPGKWTYRVRLNGREKRQSIVVRPGN